MVLTTYCYTRTSPSFSKLLLAYSKQASSSSGFIIFSLLRPVCTFVCSCLRSCNNQHRAHTTPPTPHAYVACVGNKSLRCACVCEWINVLSAQPTTHTSTHTTIMLCCCAGHDVCVLHRCVRRWMGLCVLHGVV